MTWQTKGKHLNAVKILVKQLQLQYKIGQRRRGVLKTLSNI